MSDGECGLTPTAEMVIPALLKSRRSERDMEGSPSEMTMQCFWPAAALLSPESASWREGSKDGMSPKVRFWIACLTATRSPTGLMG